MSHPLAVPLLLAMVSIAGLVAMFVLDGSWDGLFFSAQLGASGGWLRTVAETPRAASLSVA